MNSILSLSVTGISGSIFIGLLLLSKRKGKLPSNELLGIFFILLSIRLGKQIVQEYAPSNVLNIYFNLMQSAFLAIGPTVWFYIKTYLSPFYLKKNKLVHYIPSLILLLGAFHIRQSIGESLWLLIYWIVQIHPILYILLSLKILIGDSAFKNKSLNQKNWLYGILIIVMIIVSMNILYFVFNFPFYLITAILLIIIVYLFTFLAFNNYSNVISGKSEQKYKNLNLSHKKLHLVKEKIDVLMLEHKLYLNNQIKISDVSKKLNISSHIISSVINESSKMSFPQYINHLRIKTAQQKLVDDYNAKIITIAFESGFSSLSAFNRVFKSNSGMSPSKFRTKFSTKKTLDL